MADGVSEWWLDAEADPNGVPVVAHMTEDGAVHLLKCRNVNCEQGVDDLDIGYSLGEALEFDLALFPDGSPVIVVQSWENSFATVYTCLDPSCTDVAVAELGDPEPCVWPDGQPADEWHYRALDLIISPGTPPRVVYAANGELHLYTCPMATCAAPWAPHPFPAICSAHDPGPGGAYVPICTGGLRVLV